MLEFLRTAAATWIAKLFFGLLIASFAFWGIDGILLQSNTRSIAVVGDTKVSDAEFSRAFGRAMRQIELRSDGPVDQQEAVAQGLHYQVASDLVGRAMFTEVASELGIVITDEQLRAELRAIPAFIDDFGKFDRLRFDQNLQMLRYSEDEFFNTLRTDILRELIVSTVTAATVAPKTMAALIFQHRSEQRAARYIKIPPVTADDIAAPDDATLRDYYNATPGPFTSPEYRKVSVLHITAAKLAAGVAVEEADIETYYETRKDTFGAAETRTIVQAAFPDQATLGQALTRIQGGESLLTVAAAILDRSEDDLLETDVTRDDVVDSPAAAAFDLALNELSAPIDSAFGPILVSPIAITPPDVPPLEDMRDELIAALQNEQAADLMFDIINKIEDERAGGATMEAAAAAAGVDLTDAITIDARGLDQDGTPNLLVAASPALLEDINALVPGEESPLLETADEGYAIVRIDDTIPAALKPFADVKDQVLAIWKDREATARSQSRALSLGNKVNDAASLDRLAAEMGVTIEQAASVSQFARHETLSPAIVQSLFMAQNVGDIAQAGAGDGSYYFAELTAIRKFSVSDAPVQFEEMRKQLNQAYAGETMRSYQLALDNELGVTINEAVINTIVGVNSDEGAF